MRDNLAPALDSAQLRVTALPMFAVEISAMLDHLGPPISNLARSKQFFLAALAAPWIQNHYAALVYARTETISRSCAARV